MRHLSLLCLLWIACIAGCASTQSQQAPRNSVSLILETSNDLDMWSTAARELSDAIPEYDIRMVQTGRDVRSFNHIESGPEGVRVCFEPQMLYDFAGNVKGYAPLYCSALDSSSPQTSLTNAVDNYQARYLSNETVLSKSAYRAWVLANSSPQSPLCYSIYPLLFVVSNEVPIPMIENYLLACANAIEGKASWPNIETSLLTGRLRAMAAMLSQQNSFIAKSFKDIAQDNSLEGNAYGISIESYTEMMSQKKRQAEITTIEALRQSDEARLFYLSEQNAIRLLYLASRSDDMSIERLSDIIRALTPPENWPNPVTDVRNMMQMRTCQTLTMMPEMTPSLVGICLPWLRTMTRSEEDFEMALRIVEQSFYAAKPEDAPIISEVLNWLRFAPLFGKLTELRHIFGQRNAHHNNLTPEDRAILLGF